MPRIKPTPEGLTNPSGHDDDDGAEAIVVGRSTPPGLFFWGRLVSVGCTYAIHRPAPFGACEKHCDKLVQRVGVAHSEP